MPDYFPSSNVGLTMQNAKTIITMAGNPLPAGLARSRRP